MSLTQPFRLSNRYIFNLLPAPHLLITLAQLLFTLHISLDFNTNFNSKPMLTTMALNACLNGIADAVAQTVTSMRAHRSRRPRAPAKRHSVKISLDGVDEKLPSHNGELYASNGFDVDRLVRFMAWGMIMAPVQLAWFAWLSEVFPLTEESKTGMALWRVLCDQVVFAPIGLAAFFAYMTLCEMGGRKAVMRKLELVFWGALKSNYVVWPAVQIVNFRWMPLALQIPFASTVGICWTTYLSLKNEAA